LTGEVASARSLFRFLMNDFWKQNESAFKNCSLVVWRPIFLNEFLETVYTTIEESDLGLDFGQGVAGRVAQTRKPFIGRIDLAQHAHHDKISGKYGWKSCEMQIIDDDDIFLGLYGLYSTGDLSIDINTKERFLKHLHAGLLLIDIAVNAQVRDASLEKSLLALEVGKAAEDRFHDIKETLFGASGALGSLRSSSIGTKTFTRNVGILQTQIDAAKNYAEKYIKEAKNPNQLNRVVFDFCGVSRHIVRDLELRAKQRASQRGRKIDVHFDIPDERILVEGDVERLARAIGNIIYNAEHWVLRAVGRAPITRIVVTLSYDDLFCYLKVFDTGPGIIEPKRAMEKGYSLRDGTGLGLSIAKRIFEMHDGSIELTTEPGQWTSVLLSVPLAH